RQTSHEAPLLQPGIAQTPSKSLTNKSGSAGKTPIRPGAADSRYADKDAGSSSATSGAGSSFVAVMASLAVVIGVLFLVMWMMRRVVPGGTRRLPTEVVDVLGHVPLGHRQQAQLIRFGKKLVLVNVTATGAETLTEVTDPDEVEHLTNLARQSSPANPAASFRQILQQFERKPADATRTVKRPASPGSVPPTAQERNRG
ncbi:MAG TPA: flagellar biosynthetic protein FliO, partial [Pirellulales bacterium]